MEERLKGKHLFYRLSIFEKLSVIVTRASGSNGAIVSAFVMVFIWIIIGPFVHFSELWHLLIHTSTTVVTFLMVFLIQKSHNKDSLAIQLKLNELVAAHGSASNRLVDIENITEEELKVIQKYYSKLSEFTKLEGNLQQSHSIDNTKGKHAILKEMEKDMENKLKI